LVLLVDAAELGEAPGAIQVLRWEETSGLSASTHTLPPYVLARFLTAELDCDVALLGIQPADTSFGAPLSPPVRAAVEAVVRTLASVVRHLLSDY
jgi:hydrogenase 3 maturation protease